MFLSVNSEPSLFQSLICLGPLILYSFLTVHKGIMLISASVIQEMSDVNLHVRRLADRIGVSDGYATVLLLLNNWFD